MKHTVLIDDNKVTINGITNVVSVFDKEAIVETTSGRLTITGANLNTTKLEVEQGVMILTAERIDMLKYGNKKVKLSNIFK